MFRTDPDFKASLIPDFFDEDALADIRAVVAAEAPDLLEKHEVGQFGRDVVHDHPVFLSLQASILERVSSAVGEPVELSYNFLSLYGPDGVCAPHMDAPSSKWTLDLCVDQSRPWPIRVSEVVPWAEDWVDPDDGDWEGSIQKSTRFDAFEMVPGDALVFGGSSQWHYREPMPSATSEDFCTLLFFHFIPAGTSELVQPSNWARLFGVPALADLI